MVPCLLSAPGCHMVSSLEDSPGGSRPGRPPVIFNPDFFVEKLRHENPDVFLELVLSNISRLIDLPGAEFSQLLGDDGPKTPTGGFFRSFNFLKRKGLRVCVCARACGLPLWRPRPSPLYSTCFPADKDVVFGSPLTETCIAQIYQLIEYLSKSETHTHTLQLVSPANRCSHCMINPVLFLFHQHLGNIENH